MFHWFLESLESEMEESPNHITSKMVQKAFCNVSFDVLFYLLSVLLSLNLKWKDTKQLHYSIQKYETQ